MSEVIEFDGEVVDTHEEGEAYEYYLRLVRRKVEGNLADRVLKRVGREAGVVESVERDYSSGTCELCGWGEEGIEILVDGCVVFCISQDDGSFYYAGEAPEIISPYIKFNEWLDGSTEGTVDFEPYNDEEWGSEND